ncbi:MAG: LLM class F420-dependent oxidoreductase [Gammaproteobacteria bacterium]|nr:LLM class F420-dependent oxidoreductase [Gammaproteobacteria bacterium]
MKFGLFGIGSGICTQPEVARNVARAAEDVGIESLWTGEHVVLPDPREPPSPAPPNFAMLHPSTSLAFLAGVTTRVKLGTGIVLIAQRNPVVLAKEMASLDVVSQGRLILGIGAGYLHQEFAALGIPFNERGARTDEAIEVMRALWTQAHPSFDGRFTQFANIDAEPRPVQTGGPPIVVGGTSDAALKRAIRSAQGWYGFALNVEQTVTVVERLNQLANEIERPAALGELELSVTPGLRLDDQIVTDFAEAGIERLIALMPQDTEQSVLTHIENLAELIG